MGFLNYFKGCVSFKMVCSGVLEGLVISFFVFNESRGAGGGVI